MLRDRQTTETFTDPGDAQRRVNLLNWDGTGRPEGLFPPRADEEKRP
jgi:nitrate reductase beta subunit